MTYWLLFVGTLGDSALLRHHCHRITIVYHWILFFQRHVECVRKQT